MKIKIWSLCGAMVLISSMASGFMKPTVVCNEAGKAFVQTVSWDTGCRTPLMPYYDTLLLSAETAESGRIEVELGYEGGWRNPHCQNPRGRPYNFYLPLPVKQGQWEIHIDDVYRGVLSFNPECQFEPNGDNA